MAGIESRRAMLSISAGTTGGTNGERFAFSVLDVPKSRAILRLQCYTVRRFQMLRNIALTVSSFIEIDMDEIPTCWRTGYICGMDAKLSSSSPSNWCFGPSSIRIPHLNLHVGREMYRAQA